jgi:hypothetical protein
VPVCWLFVFRTRPPNTLTGVPVRSLARPRARTHSTNQALWCKYELAVENNGRWAKAGKTRALLNPLP